MHNSSNSRGSGEQELLFLTDEQLRNGIEAMYFAYRSFTAGPDRILKSYGYGRAHHRALHFINRYPGTTSSELIKILEVSRQSLSLVLRQLIADEIVVIRDPSKDRRKRHIHLTERGKRLEAELSNVQKSRMRIAYRAAGPEAVSGFRTVLDRLISPYPHGGSMGDHESD